MPELITALSNFSVLGQEAIHRTLRAEIRALVEQGGVDLGGGQVHEAGLVQPREHRALLVGGQGTRRAPPPRRQVPGAPSPGGGLPRPPQPPPRAAQAPPRAHLAAPPPP